MSIQSLRTPATRMVTAPVLPITKKIEKFKAKAQRAFVKKIQKLNWICETSICGFSKKYQGTNKNTKLHITKYDKKLVNTDNYSYPKLSKEPRSKVGKQSGIWASLESMKRAANSRDTRSDTRKS